MLRSCSDLLDFRLRAVDGEIGRCEDFIFEDRDWTIRYLVADTGPWLLGQKVLLSPLFFEEPDFGERRFRVRLEKEQVENAPPLDAKAPVSRKYTLAWARYYAAQPFWTGPEASAPKHLAKHEREEAVELLKERADDDDLHLRSVEEVTGYRMHATDDTLGHVEDFVVDEEAWTIRYLVVDTRRWLPGRKVLVALDWVQGIDWVDKEVRIDLSREDIEQSPEYDHDALIEREYEEELHDFYGKTGYWME